MTNNQKRIKRLEDEAAVSELIGKLAAEDDIRKAHDERARRYQALADAQKRRDTAKQ